MTAGQRWRYVQPAWKATAMSFTRYEYLKVTKQWNDNSKALGISVPSDYDNAEVYASVLRLERKGYDRAEAIEIAGQWHERTSEEVQAIIEAMEQDLDDVKIPNYIPFDEGQFDEEDT